jgi:hypothetical protein
LTFKENQEEVFLALAEAKGITVNPDSNDFSISVDHVYTNYEELLPTVSLVRSSTLSCRIDKGVLGFGKEGHKVTIKGNAEECKQEVLADQPSQSIDNITIPVDDITDFNPSNGTDKSKQKEISFVVGMITYKLIFDYSHDVKWGEFIKLIKILKNLQRKRLRRH